MSQSATAFREAPPRAALSRSRDLADDFRAFIRADRLTPRAAQRHSQRVKHLRLIVPAAAVALLATYALSATPPKIDPRFLDNFTQSDVDSDSMQLQHPRYAGEDLTGLPFEVSARTAARDPNAPNLIDLQDPEAMRTLQGGTESEFVNVSAKAGRLDTTERRIDLRDSVRLEHSLGGAPIIFNTEAAEVDLNANTVTSKAAVSGESAQGTVAADSVTVYQGEGRAVLEGNVKIRLTPTGDIETDAPETQRAPR